MRTFCYAYARRHVRPGKWGKDSQLADVEARTLAGGLAKGQVRMAENRGQTDDLRYLWAHVWVSFASRLCHEAACAPKGEAGSCQAREHTYFLMATRPRGHSSIAADCPTFHKGTAVRTRRPEAHVRRLSLPPLGTRGVSSPRLANQSTRPK